MNNELLSKIKIAILFGQTEAALNSAKAERNLAKKREKVAKRYKKKVDRLINSIAKKLTKSIINKSNEIEIYLVNKNNISFNRPYRSLPGTFEEYLCNRLIQEGFKTFIKSVPLIDHTFQCSFYKPYSVILDVDEIVKNTGA